MTSNVHVRGGTERRDVGTDAGDSESTVIAMDGGGQDKDDPAGRFRTWLAPAGSALEGVALLIERSVGLLSALASGVIAMVIRPSSDPAVNASLVRRRTLNAPAQREAASELAVVKDGNGLDRTGHETDDPIDNEPSAQRTPAPLAAGPIGRRPSNGHRGRG